MGALLSSLRTRCINIWFRLSKWLPYRPWWAGSPSCSPYQKPPRDVKKGHTKTYDPVPKRRALLVGISYHDSTDPIWIPLETSHINVDQFKSLLIHIFGYSPEDLVILKDDPRFPDHLQPTRANMIRELNRLVSGAAPEDRFTFLYSGHTDLQPSFDDNEEDDNDNFIITCDLERIIDSELKYTLVNGLPVGCSLLAIFDASHSGTMLDLPHYDCNNVYVPWISKGERRTNSLRNTMVRRNALNSFGPFGTDDGGALSVNQMDQPEMSLQSGPLADTSILTTMRCDSPISAICDGWCGYDLTPRPTVVSLSACSDMQRAWEGPRGSLTAMLCEILKKQPSASYRTLMSHVNFQLHANIRALHNYTLEEKKKAARGEGPGFDGEINNFQAPQLSSFSKLNMDDILRL